MAIALCKRSLLGSDTLVRIRRAHCWVKVAERAGAQHTPIDSALRLMQRGTVRARVRALGGAERALSTNCSVLATQAVASTGRRKFARTLRQA